MDVQWQTHHDYAVSILRRSMALVNTFASATGDLPQSLQEVPLAGISKFLVEIADATSGLSWLLGTLYICSVKGGVKGDISDLLGLSGQFLYSCYTQNGSFTSSPFCNLGSIRGTWGVLHSFFFLRELYIIRGMEGELGRLTKFLTDEKAKIKVFVYECYRPDGEGFFNELPSSSNAIFIEEVDMSVAQSGLLILKAVGGLDDWSYKNSFFSILSAWNTDLGIKSWGEQHSAYLYNYLSCMKLLSGKYVDLKAEPLTARCLIESSEGLIGYASRPGKEDPDVCYGFWAGASDLMIGVKRIDESFLLACQAPNGGFAKCLPARGGCLFTNFFDASIGAEDILHHDEVFPGVLLNDLTSLTVDNSPQFTEAIQGGGGGSSLGDPDPFHTFFGLCGILVWRGEWIPELCIPTTKTLLLV